VPSPNAETGEIALTFQIEPNARTYVRHINFNGVEHTNDEVLRRELRQLEGAVLSNASITRSQERLQRLPYIEKVETETRRVEGAADLVDIDVTVEEGPSSQLGGGIGYSERQSFMLQGSYIDSNLFGTGDRLAVELNGGKYTQVFSVAHTDPYFTADGVARSFNASYVERDRLTSSFSQFTTQTYSAGFGIGYPLSEEQFFNVGLVYSHETWRRHSAVRPSFATGCATTATTIFAAWAATGFSEPFWTRWRSPVPGCTTAAIARCFQRAADRIG
jgi:outer membrane protein insertion porin family